MLKYNNIYRGTLDEDFADKFSRSAKIDQSVRRLLCGPSQMARYHNLHAKCFRVIATE